MIFTKLRSLGRYAPLVLCFTSIGFSQTVNVNLASDGSAAPSALSFNLASTVGSEPAGLEFTLAYPASVSNVTVNAGPAATAAGKTITCSGPSGNKTCLLTGTTNASIANGVVAVVGWGSTPVTGSTLTSFQASTGASVSPDGTRLPTVVGTSITVPPPPVAPPPPAAVTLKGLSCSSSQLAPGSPAHCTVSLTGPAPANGAVILLAGSSPVLYVPSGIVLAGGLTQGDFYVVQNTLATAAPATLSATYGTQTISAALTLAVPVTTLQSVTCASAQIAPGTPVRCTVALTGPAPANGATVLLSSNNLSLNVPSGIVLASGLTQADFMVAQTALTTTTAASIKATYGTKSTTASLKLAAPISPPAAPAPSAAPTLQKLSCVTTQLTLNASSLCTIALTAPAPANGAVVLFSSNNNALSVPSGIVLAAGLTQASFYVVETALTTTTSATLQATYGTKSLTTALKLSSH